MHIRLGSALDFFIQLYILHAAIHLPSIGLWILEWCISSYDDKNNNSVCTIPMVATSFICAAIVSFDLVGCLVVGSPQEEAHTIAKAKKDDRSETHSTQKEYCI